MVEPVYEKLGTYGFSEVKQVEQTIIYSIKSLREKLANLEKQVIERQERVTEVKALIAKAQELGVEEET